MATGRSYGLWADLLSSGLSLAILLGMTATTGEEHRGLDPAANDRPMIPPDTFGNRIMLARHMRALSIREAADLCDIGRGAWTNWERGARPIDMVEHVDVISEKLNVDRDWLLRGGPLARPASRIPRRRGRGDATVYYPRAGENGASRPRNYPDGFRRPSVQSRPIAA